MTVNEQTFKMLRSAKNVVSRGKKIENHRRRSIRITRADTTHEATICCAE